MEITTQPKFPVGKTVRWYTGPCNVIEVSTVNGEHYYKLKHRDFDLFARASEAVLSEAQSTLPCEIYSKQRPSFLSVDNFYKDPQTIRKIALEQNFHTNAKAYKGKRSEARFLLPGLKEEFERLVGGQINGWLSYNANGIFQITKFTDPLVWHSDLQSYAAAIYLTPNAPVTAGTSFWRDRKYGCRRPPFHPKERARFESDEARKSAQNEIYSEYNLLHPDNWELVDKVGATFNRLVMWDAQLIHSASSYEGFLGEQAGGEAENSRLIQLFFFDVS